MVYILLEQADNGSLFYFIHPEKGIPELLALRFLYQTALAVEYLHDQEISHRDIKPENILLDENFNVKLCDFGWACNMERGEVRTSLCGTFEYMSPEIVLKHIHTNKIDVWCLGIFLFEMIHGKPPIKAKSIKDLKKFFENEKISIKASISEETRDLIQNMLLIDEYDRFSIDQVLKHPVFKKIKPNSSKPISKQNFTLLLINFLWNTKGGRNKCLPEALKSLPKEDLTFIIEKLSKQVKTFSHNFQNKKINLNLKLDLNSKKNKNKPPELRTKFQSTRRIVLDDYKISPNGE